MTRECLKKHCEMMCNRYSDVPSSSTYEEHRLVLDLLDQTEWIPVSERLPQETGLYLVSTGNLVVTYPFDRQNFRLRPGSTTVYADAWMKLPKPYDRSEE